MSDYYKILGVSKKSTAAEIKKTYRKLARKYHPDLNPGDKAAEKKFKEITEAYEVLNDPVKKKEYDMYGDLGAYSNNSRSNANAHNFDGFNFNSSGSNSFGDIFETIFGGYEGQGKSQSASSNTPMRGEELRYSINLGFIDAVKGIETSIQINRKDKCNTCSGKGIDPSSKKTICPYCKGSGKTQKQTGFMKFAVPCQACGGTGSLPGSNCKVCHGDGRVDKLTKIRVRIPQGVDDQSKVRIPNKGNAGKFGGPAGNLIITINVTKHKFYRRNGMNLEIILPITFSESALGGKVEVPTLDGKTLLKLPPSTSSGQKMRLKGKGVGNNKTDKRGDLIVEIKIVPPSIQDIEVRKLLKEIDKKATYNPREELVE
jgi:molecular chaperone DnaJ